MFLQREGSSSKNPIEVTVYDLGMDPQKFDGRLVRVWASVAGGWEGDIFLSDPDPQNMPSGSPGYLWFYPVPKHDELYGSIRSSNRGSVRGWFTGYFHYVAKPQIVNGAFYPGHLQFEAIEVSIPPEQPLSLAEAIRAGDLVEVRKILQSGAKVNVRDEYQSFPLFEAISSSHLDIAEELLVAGADPKLALPNGTTALMMAAWNGDLKSAKLLVDRGVSVNAAGSNGETALILASQTCPDGKMVQMLLDAGANPNAKTTNGTTSLMAAVGNPLVAEKLLKAGADPSAKDSYGHDAEDGACDRGEKGHYQVCALLREALKKN